MNVMKIQNLRKSYGETEVLKDINLEIEEGEVLAVIGPSGSGKTTLLRCMNFLEKSNAGTMIFEGREYHLEHMRTKEIAAIRKKTAFVFQNYNLFANKTALDNVTLGLRVARKVSKEEAKKIGMEMLEKVGMEQYFDHYPIQLSGGQQQRVAIARALAGDPSIIFFDEPTSALDPELIGEVLAVMKQLAAEGRTMVVVTHEMNFAKNVSDRVVFMDEGEILEQASSKEFFENPEHDRVRDFLQRIGSQQ